MQPVKGVESTLCFPLYTQIQPDWLRVGFCVSKTLCPPHLDSWSYLLRQLHVQAFLAGVQTVDHLLVLQLARANHQPCKVPPEKLSHSSISAWVGQDRDEEKKTVTHTDIKKVVTKVGIPQTSPFLCWRFKHAVWMCKAGVNGVHAS